MGLFDSGYSKAKAKGVKYTTVSDEEKIEVRSSFWRNGHLAFDEILEEISSLKAENAELKSQLNRIIELLEKK